MSIEKNAKKRSMTKEEKHDVEILDSILQAIADMINIAEEVNFMC